MTSDEIRTAFLRFFESKDHKIMPSSSLIPKGDPTLLLTTAGMVQFKPYFLGVALPPHPRLSTSQKCFRTTDVDSVGDNTHLTFFEMLGNFSIGDYFKKEAIAWAWEFVTEHLRIPAERLWITIFLDDDEAFGYWRQIGIPENKIVRFGEKDNFWGPAGDSGPCGPCSELHYDLGAEFGCGRPTCGPNCECGRFTEIWNLVFVQYFQDKDKKRSPLPKPSIDTGMGLERVSAVVQGKTNVYGTDLFTPLLDRICGMVGKQYGCDGEADRALRIVAEHSRGIAFLIADGVIPGNEGRSYVLRRLLRRAALFGRKLGLDRPFLVDMAETVVARMGEVYPELTTQKDFIFKVIELEETRFYETLSTGLQLLTNIMDEHKADQAKVISGVDAFRLYDTYGFPVELTKEVAAERGFSVDTEGFEKEMEKQRQRAQAAQKFGVLPKVAIGLHEQLKIQATPFVGYKELEKETQILGILLDSETGESVKEGQEAGLILAETPFYAEMGGQVGDTGVVHSRAGHFVVSNTVRLPSDIILHQGKLIKGVLHTGETVMAEVNRERRLDVARNHTATHLLQSALREVLGKHIQQRGSLVAPDRLRFDFSHLSPLTAEEVRKVERLVNARIRQNLPVYDEELPYRQAIEQGVIALFDEKYGEVVRVLEIGEPAVSAELCGGTHLTATGEIGYLHITSESSIGTGLRRIEAVTGRGSQEIIERQFTAWQELAAKLGTTLEDAPGKISDVLEEVEKERARAQALERELAKRVTESLLGQVEVIKGINVVAARVPPTRPDTLREMYDIVKDRLKSAVVVLGTVYEDKPLFIAGVTSDLVAKGYDAGKIIREVAKVAGGGGG
ncbi:MAG: alanine--tRNA ligase, partial [Chloroflexi bacterium]|nr:alanine--tRNA ligase [Chloroflexota bacterium]